MKYYCLLLILLYSISCFSQPEEKAKSKVSLKTSLSLFKDYKLLIEQMKETRKEYMSKRKNFHQECVNNSIYAPPENNSCIYSRDTMADLREQFEKNVSHC